ncbi:MAG TPA: prolyl oligopeptidase family serine peptidase [Acidimicrobiales bacterium]|nr:prolyl oligopeptidase family serine peptidase [Acidimicrobiales bacterium]
MPCTDTDPGAVHFTLPVAGGTAEGFYAVPDTNPVGIVVFSHGYGHSSYSWQEHAARVAASLHVIAIAMDGRGLTFLPTFKKPGVPDTAGWPVKEAAEDGIAAAQLFQATCSTATTIVNYGVSLGGNTSGIMAAAGAKRADGTTPLFDWWIDIEGVNNLIETYMEARVALPSAAAAIEAQTGGPLESHPDEFRARTNVLHASDMKAAGLKGVVLVQGVDDGLVPYNQSQEMFAALTAARIPTQYFTVTLKSDESERETTLSGAVANNVQPGYRSPLAGHASEMSTTHIVSKLGFQRLDAVFAGNPPACTKVAWVDGQVGSASDELCHN